MDNLKEIPMVGSTVSHYTILERLGGGGMGVVYKAKDTKLDRPVALKFLPPELTRDPEARQRFVHEAKAASALQHNSICTVHDIDQTEDGQIFIVMDLYEGESLKTKTERGPLKIDEAIDFASQVAEGLAEAHQHGIVHRDIKPANVLVTKSGIAKIVDFGLAKLTGRSLLTKSGTTLGTVTYMSPEQASGEPVDLRTDIWSLGVVLYEMITGQPPFKADYENAVVYSILNVQPRPITGLRTDVPMELERIVTKAMAKKPEERYQHADELLVDLRKLGKDTVSKSAASEAERGHAWMRSMTRNLATPWVLGIILAAALCVAAVWFVRMRTAERSEALDARSIAVLPLNTLGKTENDEAFADGIHGEILTRLAKIKGLRVKAQTTVLQYRDTKKPIKQVGEELGVDYLMEGSVQRSGDRIRIQAQLINAQSEDHVWAETYEKPYGDIFAIQSEIATKIASELKVTLTPRESSLIARKPTENTAAYDYYLAGNHIWATTASKEDERRAGELLEKAVALDPNFALAWAKISIVQSDLMKFECRRSPERIASARAAWEKAESLAPGIAEVHHAKGEFYYQTGLDSALAMTELESAVQEEPTNSELLVDVGMLIEYQGYTEQGLAHLLRAYELDPSGGHAILLTQAYLIMRRFDDVERMAAVMIATEQNDQTGYYFRYISSLRGRGDLARARDVLEEARRNTKQKPIGWEIGIDYYARDYAAAYALCLADSPPDTLLMSYLCALMGKREESRKFAERAAANFSRLAEQEPEWEPHHLWLARAYALLGRGDDARRELSMVVHRGLKFAQNPGLVLELEAMHVHILLGDYERAISEIEELISIPSNLTRARLRLDPIYDPLRSNPKFQALLARAN